jgi:hypothetical protein
MEPTPRKSSSLNMSRSSAVKASVAEEGSDTYR